MKLKTLIKHLPIQLYKGSKEIEITGICAHSKKVSPGNLFIARKGALYDGSDYIQEAVTGGAHAVLTSFKDPYINAVQLVGDDIASLEADLAFRFYGAESKSLKKIAITGTNGKTTTSYILRALYQQALYKTGLIGSIEYDLGHRCFPAERTTPDAISNYKMLAEMTRQKCQVAIMEVTSHALVQHRVKHLDFAYALFTNLSQDHLDYHGSMQAYCAAKSKLFASCCGCVILNANSPWSHQLTIHPQARIVWYGVNVQADLYAEDITFFPTHTEFTLVYGIQKVRCCIPYIGEHNISNFLAAALTALQEHMSLESIVSYAPYLPQIPGRLQKVGSQIFIDFAHTPDGLEQALVTLKQHCEGKLIVVFGCGGNRDRDKREKMGAIAHKYADVVMITTDNPRHEDPWTICQQIALGCKEYSIEIDREKAIAQACQQARAKDIILIAGKGHEKIQEYATTTKEFDDVAIAKKYVVSR